MKNIPQVFPIFLLLLQTHLRALGFCLVSFQTQKKWEPIWARIFLNPNLAHQLPSVPPTTTGACETPPVTHLHALFPTRHAPVPRLGKPFKISQTKTPPQPRSHPLHHHFHHAPISSASYSSVVYTRTLIT
jgi:hypothetical protein